MKRIVIVQKVAAKCEGPLTPAATKIFKFKKDAASQCTVDWNGADLFQVKGSWGEQTVVNLKQKVCTCRKWEVSGIPCKHAIACIYDMADNNMDVGIPEDWVHDSYKLKTWIEVYSHKVNPVNGPQFWKKFECATTLLPPKVVPQIGRPSKKRKKSKGEIEMVKDGKLTRKGKQVRCSICKMTGHNKRSCPANKGGTSQSSKVHAKGNKSASQPSQSAKAPTNVVSSQASQPTQTSTGPRVKRTKHTASRLTPEKQANA